MQTPEALKAQIDSTEDLQSVVKTMKALAAVSIQQYETAIQSLRRYSRTIELGLQVLLRARYFAPADEQTLPFVSDVVRALPPGLVVLGSDQGLCGQFNQQIAQHTAQWLQQSAIAPADCPIVVVGARPLAPLRDVGITVTEELPVPSSVDGITALVQDVLLLIERWQTQQRCNRILVFYNNPISAATYESRHEQLLPLNLDWFQQLQQTPWDSPCLPTFTMPEEDLFSQLIRQYLFITLYRAMAASLASENASRLAAMQSAERNIRDRLADLTGEYRRQRQSAITAELLDVVSGFEALTGE